MPTLRAMVEALIGSEQVCINVCNGAHEAEAREVLRGLPMERISFHLVPTNEPWCRDHGPIFVIRDERWNRLAPEPGRSVRSEGAPAPLAVVDWDYNAWGNKYPPFDLDEVAPTRVAEILDVPVFYPGMILEGGAIDVNGAGALLTSESCLLNKNRNPNLSRDEIEKRLKDYLGVCDILWLGDGIAGDDTDGHIDDLARFVSESTVVTVMEKNRDDENYEPLRKNLARLRAMKIGDRAIEVITLPMPKKIMREELRLPGTYANFYIANTCVLVPTFADPADEGALSVLRACFPGRRVIGIDCRELIWGLGAFHCLTQQQPAV
jgi:agmatine deiminase